MLIRARTHLIYLYDQKEKKRYKTGTEESMTIDICSQAEALELAGKTQVSTGIISITSLDEKDVRFPENPHIKEVFHLKCNDLTEEYDEEGIPYGRPLPKQADFCGLRDFVTRLSCEHLIVHCWEGTSRSAAVAEAVYEFRGRIDDIRARRTLSPNPLVYELVCRELY